MRSLVASQATSIPDAASLPLAHAADGWDCSVWRLGDRFAVRLPRRALAAPLVLHEQQVLSGISARLAATGIGVPAPIVSGRPGFGYPWSWSVVPWFDGLSGLATPRADRTGWATSLAQALLALHVVAPPTFPVNPVRGVPLVRRAEAVAGRFESLRGRVDHDALARLHELWDAAHRGAAVGRLAGVDPRRPASRAISSPAGQTWSRSSTSETSPRVIRPTTSQWHGSPSIPQVERASSLRCGDHYDAATWTRAHGWAASVTLMLLDQSDDNPEYAALGAEALGELAR